MIEVLHHLTGSLAQSVDLCQIAVQFNTILTLTLDRAIARHGWMRAHVLEGCRN